MRKTQIPACVEANHSRQEDNLKYTPGGGHTNRMMHCVLDIYIYICIYIIRRIIHIYIPMIDFLVMYIHKHQMYKIAAKKLVKHPTSIHPPLAVG